MRAPAPVSAAASSILADALMLDRASSGSTTLTAMERADHLAGIMITMLKEYRLHARAAIATERASQRDEAQAKLARARRNEEIRQRRKIA